MLRSESTAEHVVEPDMVVRQPEKIRSSMRLLTLGKSAMLPLNSRFATGPSNRNILRPWASLRRPIAGLSRYSKRPMPPAHSDSRFAVR